MTVTTMNYHLAQINIAHMAAPLTDPAMQGFVENLDALNALAETSPGFVWRLKDDHGDATSFRIYEDETLLINLSVWEDVETLRAYVYHGRHVDFVRNRKAWFKRFEGAYYALWWIEAGQIPTVEEAAERLEYLRAYGDSSYAFTFKQRYPAPNDTTTMQ